MNYIKCSKFEDLDDFHDSLLRGREIVFKYNGKEYGIFLLMMASMLHNLTTMRPKKVYQTPDEALEYTIDGVKIKDIITTVEIVHRGI